MIDPKFNELMSWFESRKNDIGGGLVMLSRINLCDPFAARVTQMIRETGAIEVRFKNRYLPITSFGAKQLTLTDRHGKTLVFAVDHFGRDDYRLMLPVTINLSYTTIRRLEYIADDMPFTAADVAEDTLGEALIPFDIE